MAGIDNNTLLYLRGDSFTDLSFNPKTISNNGTTIIDNKLNFDGVDDTISVPNNIIDLANDFTIEFDIDINYTQNQYKTILGNGATAPSTIQGITLYVDLSSLGCEFGFSSGKYQFKISLSEINNKPLSHVAFVKQGSTYTFFVNGISKSSYTNSSNIIKNSQPFLFGRNRDNETYLDMKLYNVRISDVARYTEDFTPPTKPFNSITINKTNQTDANIEFSVTKLGQETINKVEVLVNGIVSETYTDSYDNIDYLIDKELCAIGNNDITIRVTFDDTYTEELSLNHKVTIDKLPLETPLLDTVERVKTLTTLKQSEKTMLSNILTSKNVEVSEEDKMSDLIGKVGLFKDYCPDIFYLYKDGYINESKNSIKQVYKSNSSLSEGIIYNEDSIKLQCTSSGGTAQLYFVTINPLDFSEYSTLKFEYTIISRYYVGSTNYSLLKFGVHSNNTDISPFGLAVSEYWLSGDYNLNTKYEASVNITNLNNGYISFGLYAIQNNLSILIHKIWLEK